MEEAQALLAQGDALGAVAHLEAALANALDPARMQLAIGKARLQVPDLPGAEDAFAVAVALDGQLGEAWLRLGEIQARMEHLDAALESLAQARETVTEELLFDVLYLKGRVLSRRERFKEAQEAFQQALGIQPGHAEVLFEAAGVALRLEEDTKALNLYERAIQANADLKHRAGMGLAVAYRQAGRWREARTILDEATARQPASPELRWALAQVRLACGEWREGWADYTHRFAAGAVPYRPLPYRTWSGQPAPAQTVVVLAEQGLGDEIMLASCLPDVIARVGHCIVECEPRLTTLFSRSFPAATILPTRRERDASWLNQAAEPQWQIFSGDLPALFRQRDEDFPAHQGYLQADPTRVRHWRERLQQDLGAGLKVGISWRGGTPRTRARARTLACADWAPILGVPGCHFVNLQYGDSDAMLGQFQSEHRIRPAHYPEALADYDETAALVCALDLVVSVCTAVIHLAGALGRPVWILAPLAPEWRYTAYRPVMPWYPSTRVLRQASLEDWSGPCQEVSARLRQLTQIDSSPVEAAMEHR
jgi:tetratricopeptide (TPR) repeat protein